MSHPFGNNADPRIAKYVELKAAEAAAWEADDLLEWQRLTPLVGAALKESGLKVRFPGRAGGRVLENAPPARPFPESSTPCHASGNCPMG
jgi:hypothetical protein